MVTLNTICVRSEDVVSKEIDGELIIVPIWGGIGDMEDKLFSLNETGKAIWERMDGKMNLREVAEELGGEFEAPQEELEKDVIGFVEELLKRKVLVEVS